MRRFTMLAGLGLALGACGGADKTRAEEPIANRPASTPVEPAPPPAPPSRSAVALAKMNEYTNAMCACTTKDCVQDVSDDMSTWAQEMAQSSEEPVKMSEDEMKQATEIGTRMAECMQTVMAGSSSP